MRKILFLISIMLAAGSSAIAGPFTSGSTGALGAFSPIANTEVQLPADGILNYTTVNIPAGVTVTFKKNAANTPVYILATGDVTVSGTINVNGANANGMFPGKGVPGGFDGGLGGTFAAVGGKGLGPGGGNPGSLVNKAYNTQYACSGGGGGGFGSNGSDGPGNPYAPAGTGGSAYGNVRILPLIGGSGGGGGAGSTHPDYPSSGGAGGGGGGAILIATSGTITLTGSITANGGKGGGVTNYGASAGGGGAGGTVKLIADKIAGGGTISADGGIGGEAWSYNAFGGAGGIGRIRLEVNTVTVSPTSSPAYTFGYPSSVFVANIPALKITSVGGINVPANPSGTYGSPDITLPAATANPITVTIEASNIPTTTTVRITSVPENGSAASANATLSGTNTLSTGTAQINLSTQYQCILTATATFTIQTAMYYEGEKIEKVRVASTMGKGSEVVYITESGKEIPAEKLMASLMK